MKRGCRKRNAAIKQETKLREGGSGGNEYERTGRQKEGDGEGKRAKARER